MKILMVLTSHDKLGNTGRKTGFWLEEFAAPYYTFRDAGAEIVLASLKGGQPPLDPKSNEPNFQTDLAHRFEADADAKCGSRQRFASTASKPRTSTPYSTQVVMGRCGISPTTRIRLNC